MAAKGKREILATEGRILNRSTSHFIKLAMPGNQPKIVQDSLITFKVNVNMPLLSLLFSEHLKGMLLKTYSALGIMEDIDGGVIE